MNEVHQGPSLGLNLIPNPWKYLFHSFPIWIGPFRISRSAKPGLKTLVRLLHFMILGPWRAGEKNKIVSNLLKASHLKVGSLEGVPISDFPPLPWPTLFPFENGQSSEVDLNKVYTLWPIQRPSSQNLRARKHSYAYTGHDRLDIWYFPSFANLNFVPILRRSWLELQGI